MKRKAAAMLLGLGLLAGSVALAQFGGLFAPDVPSVTVEELIAASEQGGFPVDGDEGRKRFLLVDVRDDNEHSVSLIPGAITRSDYESNRALYVAQRIVPYCTVGYRSGRYTRELRQQGVDAVNFEGSIMAWVEAGQPLVTPNGKDTRRVHTWSRQIKAPPGYEQVVD
jgi:rhodanese-related sulfurtransferase